MQVLMAALAGGVALAYFTIAAVIVPRINLANATPRFTLLFRLGAAAFFVGGGLTHVYIGVDALDQPVETNELAFHTAQFIGGWLFIFAALRLLDINVERKTANVEEKLSDLEELTLRDPLTGAYNRRHFEEAMPAELNRYERYGVPVALVHIDVDDFKRVNDAESHTAGDDALRSIARAAFAMLRPSDSIVRLGGDEFALLLPGANRMEALGVAERLRAKVSDLSVEDRAPITISAGIASCPEDGVSVRDLTSHADEALYFAKRNGKDRCSLPPQSALDLDGA